MSYATPEQFIRAFSEREARTLTDEDMTGFIDEEKLASALARASAQIDGYLVGRYRRGLTAGDSGGLLLRYRAVITWRPITVSAQKKFRCATGTPSAFWRKSRQDKPLGRDTSGSVIQSSSQVRIRSRLPSVRA
ncbi:phage protein Gp36 family protein [Escherichia coli]|uniref:phage protein Gp36 family protein n=1 Tax=Escherichia coli TaxID=562 RepID=UPI002FCCF6F3